MEYQTDMPMTSGPVDPENPTFDSLLGALKACHEGEMGMDVLEKYHVELSRQLEESREYFKNMEITEVIQETRDMCLGSLGIVKITMDTLKAYIEKPAPETLGACVQSLLNSRAAMKYVHDILDENIKQADIKE